MKPPWNGRSVNRSLVAASIAVMLSVFPAGASVASADSPANYVPRAKGPLKVAGVPTGLSIADLDGDAQSELAVLNRTGGIQRFANFDYGHLRLTGTIGLPGESPKFDGAEIGSDSTGYAVPHPDSGTVSLVKAREDEEGGTVTEVPTGGRPTSATLMSSMFTSIFFPGQSSASQPWVGVTDSEAGTFSILNPSLPAGEQVKWTADVGQNPVASDSIMDFLWFVVNEGSDDVSFVRLVAGDADPAGHFEPVETTPVGDSPVDVQQLDWTGASDAMAVVNRGSGTVSIIEETTSGNMGQNLDIDVIQTVRVGTSPTSVAVVHANGDRFEDLAVTNSGSDDVSILINDRNTGFTHGDRIKVGDRPVAVTAMRLDRYFNDDLAVANAGDRNVSLLLRRDGPGTCHGRPAHTIDGTEFDDLLNGTRDPDFTRGFAGNDDIHGSTGYDCLSGGTGRDDIFGGFSNDRISGGDGADELSGFQGNDLIRAGRGDDEVCDYDQRDLNCYGSPFANYRPNLPDVDRVFGGPGDDLLSAGPGRDRISGGTGNDLINSLDVEVDRIDCGPGRDKAYIDNRDKTTNCEKVIKRQSR